MIPTLLAAAVGALGTLPAPNVNLERHEVRRIGIEVVLEVSDTHFEARNLGRHDYLLVFGDADHGVLSHALLHAGSTVSYDFQAGLLDGIFFEALSLSSEGWIASGALPLGELASKRPQAIWVQKSERQLNAWIERPEGFDLWSAFGPLAPRRAQSERQATQSSDSLHVPVVDPGDEPEEERPPVLEPKPLPPV